MKKLISLTLAAGMLLGIVGCSGDGGGDELAGLALLGGSQSVTDQSAPMKFMEFMYNDEQGKKLNDIAMGGMGELSPVIQQKVNNTLDNKIFRDLNVDVQDGYAANWWQKLDINTESTLQYFHSSQGQQAYIAYVTTGMEQQNSIIAPRKATQGIGYIEPIAYLQMSFDSISHCFDLTFLGLIAIQQSTQNTQKLVQEQIARGFEETNYHISELATWLKEKDLRDAKVALYSKIDEFSTLDGVENSYRQALIKEFFTNGFEEMSNLAFESAVERTSELNGRSGGNKIPGIMLVSDIIFFKQLSGARISYSSNFYNGMTLLRFRANVSKNDLARLKKIKAALIKDFPATPAQVQLDILAVLVSWEINLRAHIAVVYGYDIDEVKLSDPKNVGLATGTFGDYCGIPNNSQWGEVLVNAAAMPLTALFGDGDELTSIFDMGKSGDLAGGKSVRIVANGKNVALDYGLIPVYKKGLTKDSESPDGGHCFIDPATGRFVLPRPIYWSKMDSFDSIVNPEIGLAGYTPAIHVSHASLVTYPGNGKFGNQCLIQAPGAFQYGASIYPFGSEGPHTFRKGTISFWTGVNATGPISSAYNNTYLNDSTYIQLKADYNGVSSLSIVVNGVIERSISRSPRDAWHHCYIVWDADAGLGGGMTIRVYFNTEEVLQSSTSFTPGVILNDSVVDVGLFSWAWVSLDNFKVWNHVVTEDPAFEYNGGSGREKALHPVYSVENAYEAVITGIGNGVGFYSIK